jgi:hypothetical protein
MPHAFALARLTCVRQELLLSVSLYLGLTDLKFVLAYFCASEHREQGSEYKESHVRYVSSVHAA